MARRRPLEGIKVIELAGLAPVPFAGLVLADFGATVIRVDRPHSRAVVDDVLCRGKRSIAVSLKDPAGRELALKLIASADVLLDPYRPGVLEKLGLGPDECARATNGKLVYARIRGFEPTGPYAKMAGHDINYIALAGVLSMMQPPESPMPVPPLNLLGDFAGGGLLCALGIMMALFERTKSGKGQVVEADMVNGSRYVATFPLLLADSPLFSGLEAGTGHLNGAAPWYGAYKTKDGRFMSVGAIEPQFYAELLRLLEPHVVGQALDAASQHDTSAWPEMKQILRDTFASKTQQEWTDLFLGTDACVAPILTPQEVARDKGVVAEPSPRLSRTPARAIAAADQDETLEIGRDTIDILREMGLEQSEIDSLAKKRIIEVPGQSSSKL